MSYVDTKKLMATTDSPRIYRDIDYTEGPQNHNENGDPGVPIFMGSPKFYDPGGVGESGSH